MVRTVTAVGSSAEDTSSRPFIPWLVAITAMALIVRLAYVWFVYRFRTINGDPLYYHFGANLLADGRGFLNPLRLAAGVTEPGADHPPLYIVFLAGFSLIGIRSITGHMLVSCLLGAASVAVGGLAGRRIAGPRVGLIAAVLLALYPNVWRFDAMLLSETLVIFMVNVTLLSTYRYLDRPSLGRLAMVSGAVALCALTRSELVLLFLVLVVPLALTTATRQWRTRIKWLAAAAAVAISVLSPWVAYNLGRFDRPVLLSSQLELTIALANCDQVYYGPNIGYWSLACGSIESASPGGEISTTDGSSESRLLDQAVSYVRSHPGRWLAVEGVRLARILNVWNPSNAIDIDTFVEGNPKRVAQLSLVSLWPMVVGSVIGTVSLRRRKIVVFPLLSPCAVTIITVLVFYASGRFRAAAEPALCLMTAVAVEAAWSARGPGNLRTTGDRCSPSQTDPDECGTDCGN